MSDCDPCKPVDCANEDDFNLHNLQSGQVRAPAVPSGTEPCKTCLPIDCSDGSRLDDDFNLYRLQSELYPLVIPFGLNVPGAERRMVCCDGLEIIRIVPQGLSPGGFAFLIGQMLDECALREPFCAGAGTGTPPVQMLLLRVTCCDGSIVARQIPTFTSDSALNLIHLAMARECAFACGGAGVLVVQIDIAVDIVIDDLGEVITIKRALISLLVSGTNAELAAEAVAELALVDTLRDDVTSLIVLINLLEDVPNLTPPQIAIIDVLRVIANELLALADLMDSISNLVAVIAAGGDVQAANVLLAANTTALLATAAAKDQAVLELPTVGNTPEILLLGELITVLADVVVLISITTEIIVALDDLRDCFISGDPACLLNSATVITDLANDLDALVDDLAADLALLQALLDAAILDGVLTDEQIARLQAIILLLTALISKDSCTADALRGMAAVATATATGVGMVAALAALEAIAVCLEGSVVLLVATGDHEALILSQKVQVLADQLRTLALGLVAPEVVVEAMSVVLRLELVLLLVVLLELEVFTIEQIMEILTPMFLPNITLQWICWPDNHIVTRLLPGVATTAQLNAARYSMIAECLAREDNLVFGPPGFGPDGQPNPRQIFASAATTCTVFCPEGTPFSWTSPAGLYIGLSQVAANQAAYRGACDAAAANRVCLSNLPSLYCVGSAFSANITTGGLSSGAGNVWTLISGALPTGLSLVPHGTYASIAGTATGTGTWVFTIQMVASNGARNSRSYTMEGLQVLPLTLPTFQVGTPYSVQLTLSGSFGGTITFAVTSGVLPVGITLTEAGLLAGIPESASAFSFTIAGTEA